MNEHKWGSSSSSLSTSALIIARQHHPVHCFLGIRATLWLIRRRELCPIHRQEQRCWLTVVQLCSASTKLDPSSNSFYTKMRLMNLEFSLSWDSIHTKGALISTLGMLGDRTWSIIPKYRNRCNGEALVLDKLFFSLYDNHSSFS
jgi:hypothetical protein